MNSPSLTGAAATAAPVTGPKIRALREAIGMDQATLAAAVGIGASRMCRIEREERPITPDLRRRILTALGTGLAAESQRLESIAQDVLALVRDTQQLGAALAHELGLPAANGRPH